MKVVEKVFYFLCPILFGIGVFISSVGLQGCNESETCVKEDGVETVEFTPNEIGAPQSDIHVRIEFARYYSEKCEARYCVPVEMRFYLYGKSNLGGEEELLESVRVVEIENGARASSRNLIFNTNANSNFRFVVETDVPNNCIDERGGYKLNSYEYTFETPLLEDLQGIVYEPKKVFVNDLGTFYSGVPSEPHNDYDAPLIFRIANVTPAYGAEYISMPDRSNGQLVSTDLLNAGKGLYIVDVYVRDVRGKAVLLNGVFVFEVRSFPGEIIGANYGDAMYVNPNSPTTVTSVMPTVDVSGSSFGDFNFALSSTQSTHATAILPYLSIDVNTGAVTITNTNRVVSIIDSLQPHTSQEPLITSRIDIDITGSINTYWASLYLRTHLDGMAYKTNSLILTGETQVLSSEAPVILNPDPAGYTFEYEPIFEYITINPNTGVITASGENARNGTKHLIIKAHVKPGGSSGMLQADYRVQVQIE